MIHDLFFTTYQVSASMFFFSAVCLKNEQHISLQFYALSPVVAFFVIFHRYNWRQINKTISFCLIFLLPLVDSFVVWWALWETISDCPISLFKHIKQIMSVFLLLICDEMFHLVVIKVYVALCETYFEKKKRKKNYLSWYKYIKSVMCL